MNNIEFNKVCYIFNTARNKVIEFITDWVCEHEGNVSTTLVYNMIPYKEDCDITSDNVEMIQQLYIKDDECHAVFKNGEDDILDNLSANELYEILYYIPKYEEEHK